MGKECNVTVIGGGASGIIAALEAKKNGNNVTLLERNASVGRKIAATGNGRCNFTNADSGNVEHYYGGNKKFISNILEQLPLEDILTLFDDMGVTPALEDEGKYFPLSGQASSVVELLLRRLNKNGVRIVYETKVTDIITSEKAVRIITDKGEFAADKVIIATGGMASPDSGSDGMGYALAKKLGHTAKKTMPIIVQLKTKGGFYKRLSGIRINGLIDIEADGKSIANASGDIMFFDYGLSGSAVFKVSPKAVYALAENKRVFAYIDAVPSYTGDELKKYMAKRCFECDCTVEDMLVGFMNKKLIALIVEASGIKGDKPSNKLTANEIESLVAALKRFKVEVTGTKDWDNAQATAGGIPLEEIEYNTLRSKKDKRIAFCGEILDVAGDCGGYNLTWAWASGYVAGKNISKE